MSSFYIFYTKQIKNVNAKGKATSYKNSESNLRFHSFKINQSKNPMKDNNLPLGKSQQ